MAFVQVALQASEFKTMVQPRFGRCAPPAAILQSVRSVLKPFGQGNHFDNSAQFVQHMGVKCTSAWNNIQLILQSAGPGDDVSVQVRSILKVELGLSPFTSMMVARLLSIGDPRCYPSAVCNLFLFSSMGLGMIAGLDQQEAKSFGTRSTCSAKNTKRRLFEDLLRVLPGVLQKHDKDEILSKLEQLHLEPLSACTCQHLLCEFRKLKCPKHRRNGGSKTPAADYLALWVKASCWY